MTTMIDYEARTQGSFVEKKLSSITFHYRNADPVFGVFQAKECQAMLESMQESLPIDVLVVCGLGDCDVVSSDSYLETTGQEECRGPTSSHEQGRDCAASHVPVRGHGVRHVRRR